MQQLLSRGGLKVNLDFRYTETQPLYIYIQNGRATLVMVYVKFTDIGLFFVSPAKYSLKVLYYYLVLLLCHSSLVSVVPVNLASLYRSLELPFTT